MAITTGRIAGARDLRVNADRLAARIDALGAVGATPGGGVSRLALPGEDRDGRDPVAGWMRELGLAVTIDGIGNVVGVRQGARHAAHRGRAAHRRATLKT